MRLVLRLVSREAHHLHTPAVYHVEKALVRGVLSETVNPAEQRTIPLVHSQRSQPGVDPVGREEEETRRCEIITVRAHRDTSIAEAVERQWHRGRIRLREVGAHSPCCDRCFYCSRREESGCEG